MYSVQVYRAIEDIFQRVNSKVFRYQFKKLILIYHTLHSNLAEVKRKTEEEQKRKVCLSNRQRVELFKKVISIYLYKKQQI